MLCVNVYKLYIENINQFKTRKDMYIHMIVNIHRTALMVFSFYEILFHSWFFLGDWKPNTSRWEGDKVVVRRWRDRWMEVARVVGRLDFSNRKKMKKLSFYIKFHFWLSILFFVNSQNWRVWHDLRQFKCK